jgi:hypothetical protein
VASTATPDHPHHFKTSTTLQDIPDGRNNEIEIVSRTCETQSVRNWLEWVFRTSYMAKKTSHVNGLILSLDLLKKPAEA